MKHQALLLLTILNAFILNANSKNPLLLVSFDGMRSDKFEKFLSANPSCSFNRIIKNGIKADYMLPSFPSLTFPNHVTLVTGLYPESHGIVHNTIYDPNLNKKANLKINYDIEWWNKTDPIWLEAKNQGLKTASSFWVSNNIWTRTPDIFLAYNSLYNPFERVDELINWFNKFDLDFANIYFDEPDSTGHRFGPDSEEYMNKIGMADKLIGRLLDGLTKINLIDKINIIVLGDHGMANIDSTKYIDLRNYLDVSQIDNEKSVFGIVSNIIPKSIENLDKVYESIQKIPNINVYLKQNVPVEYNYRYNDRIGQLVVVANEGYTLINEDPLWYDNGAHGYNNSLESLRTIFIARGPNFKQGKMDPFQNVNVYPLMCKLIDIKCHANNGTTRVFDSFLIDDKNASISMHNFYNIYFKILIVIVSKFLILKLF